MKVLESIIVAFHKQAMTGGGSSFDSSRIGCFENPNFSGLLSQTKHCLIHALPLLIDTICCCYRISDGNLVALEALFGCPLLMPTKDAVNELEASNPIDRYIICDALLLGAHWIRTILNNFADSVDQSARFKLIERLNQLVELEETLYSAIQIFPSYILERCPSFDFQYYNPKTGRRASGAVLKAEKRNKLPASMLSAAEIDESSASRGAVMTINSIEVAVNTLVPPLRPCCIFILGYDRDSTAGDTIQTTLTVRETFGNADSEYISTVKSSRASVLSSKGFLRLVELAATRYRAIYHFNYCLSSSLAYVKEVAHRFKVGLELVRMTNGSRF